MPINLRTSGIIGAGSLALLVCLSLALASQRAFADELTEMYEPERFTLDNGLNVWLKSRPESESVSIIVGVKVGRRYEAASQQGLAHFVEHMLFEGTSTRSHDTLARELRERGIFEWGTTSEDLTRVGLDLPPQELRFGLEWLADVLFNSAFNPDRIAMERKVAFKEIVSDPPEGLWPELAHALFDDNSIVPSQRDHKQELHNLRHEFQREDLLRFYREQYVPNNMMLAIVGDFDPAVGHHEVERVFGWRSRQKPPPRGAYEDPRLPQGPLRRAASNGADVSSCDVWYGYVLPECDVHDFELLQNAFWFVAGRVFSRLREEKGMSYDVRPVTRYRPAGSLLAVRADCLLPDMRVVERIIRGELASLPSGMLRVEDTRAMTAAVENSWRQHAQDNGDMAATFVHWAAANGSPLDVDAFRADLGSPGTVTTLARAYLRPEGRFTGHHRPLVTPRQLIATGALTVAAWLALRIVARRRNRHLLPRGEHVEVAIGSRYPPRLTAAYILGLVVWLPLPALAIWLSAEFGRWLFREGMFGPSYAWLTMLTALLVPALTALALTFRARRVAVSPNGILVRTLGCHILLTPQGIESIESGPISPWRAVLSPRQVALGGDSDRWVIVRTPRGFSFCLSVDEPDQFARDAAERLGLRAPSGGQIAMEL